MIYYKKKIQQDVGATAVEYGILSALIAVVTILALQATGTNLGTTYCTIANQLSQAVGAGATASGCSATSSSTSSSGSADSSGSDSSSDSSSDGSADASSSSDGSTVMTPASGPILIPFANAVSGDLAGFAIQGITTISGFYDANGNELTTPEELANSVGVSDDLYNQLVSAMTAKTSDEQTQLDAQKAVRDAVTASGKQYYDTASDITFTDSSGDTYTYQSVGTPEWDHNYTKEVLIGGKEVTSTLNIATSKATGD